MHADQFTERHNSRNETMKLSERICKRILMCMGPFHLVALCQQQSVISCRYYLCLLSHVLFHLVIYNRLRDQVWPRALGSRPANPQYNNHCTSAPTGLASPASYLSYTHRTLVRGKFRTAETLSPSGHSTKTFEFYFCLNE